jgi:hypothetical protein
VLAGVSLARIRNQLGQALRIMIARDALLAREHFRSAVNNPECVSPERSRRR